MNSETKGRNCHSYEASPLRRWLSILAGLALCLSGGGCSRLEPAPLRVANPIWPGYEPFYVAERMGYLDEKQVRLVEYNSTAEIVRAFGNGTIEAGLVTLDVALLLAEDFPDIRLVLVTDFSNGGDVIMARPEFASIKDLKGHRVGAEKSAVGTYMLMRALQLAEMKTEDLEIVPLEFPEHEAAFRDGSVEAVVTYEPIRTKLRDLGARQIFDSSQIPKEIVDVLVVRAAYLQAHPDTVKHLVAAYYRARAYLAEKPLEAAKIAAVRGKVSPEEFLSSLDRLLLPDAQESRRVLTGQPPELLKTAEALAAVMREKGMLRPGVDPKALFDEQALLGVLP